MKASGSTDSERSIAFISVTHPLRRDPTPPAGGTGIRSLLSPKYQVNLRTDFAWPKQLYVRHGYRRSLQLFSNDFFSAKFGSFLLKLSCSLNISAKTIVGFEFWYGSSSFGPPKKKLGFFLGALRIASPENLRVSY